MKIIRDFAPIGLINAARATWPAANWPYWHRYTGPHGEKLATKDPCRITPPVDSILRQMAELQIDDPCCFPDFDLHGAGMHWIREGGSLPLHIDAARHPLAGWTRRFNAILYLDTCVGGDLVFRDNDGNELSRIHPVKNTLALFPVNFPHEVLKVEQGERRSISLFWWDDRRDSVPGNTSAEWLAHPTTIKS